MKKYTCPQCDIEIIPVLEKDESKLSWSCPFCKTTLLDTDFAFPREMLNINAHLRHQKDLEVFKAILEYHGQPVNLFREDAMTIGFLISQDFKEVLLIFKDHPEWQKNKFNGIGGHIEGEETAKEGMIREFQEETGNTAKVDWEGTFVIEATSYSLHGFSALWENPKEEFILNEPFQAEKCFWLSFEELGFLPLVKKARWLAFLAKEFQQGQLPFTKITLEE